MSCHGSDVDLGPRSLPEVLDRPPAGGAVLVMAPHADDETLGMGGTIFLHREQQDPVDVLFLTTGAAGNIAAGHDSGEYVKLRRREAETACGLLGVRETFYWEFPDNYEVTENDMAMILPRLLDLLERGGYDVLYTPHRGELHTDHHTSAVLAARAARRMKKTPEVFGYEIWAPLEADLIVDVSGMFSRKLEAAACYESQLAVHDITRLFKCLNGYRAAFLENKDGDGEAFLRMKPQR